MKYDLMLVTDDTGDEVERLFLMRFDTSRMVAADYLGLIKAFCEEILRDSDGELEHEANQSNRTMKGGMFDGFGTIPIAALLATQQEHDPPPHIAPTPAFQSTQELHDPIAEE